MARILIVDDAAFMRIRCGELLGQHGYEVVEASDGLEALDKYKECKPDGILIDITMPNMDGLTVLKELIEMDPQAKVAMLSAMGQQSIVIDALKSGAKDFVMKPFDADRVLSAVEKLLG